MLSAADAPGKAYLQKDDKGADFGRLNMAFIPRRKHSELKLRLL